MAKKYIPYVYSEVIETDRIVEPKGASCLEFIRTGTDDVTINDGIELSDNIKEWVWINPPEMKIEQRLSIKFAGNASTTSKIVVNKYVYEEIGE